MISLTNEVITRPKWGLFAAKQQALHAIYGIQCDVWRQGTALQIARLGSTLTICGEPDNHDELRSFLSCMGVRVEGMASLLSRLALPKCEKFSIMTAPAAAACLSPDVRTSQRLSPVYTPLCAVQPEFAALSYEAWLADFSHRCRHDFSQCFVIERDGVLLATFSILFRAAGQAIGGALAVHPAARGSGYGARLLAHSAAVCAMRGETLSLMAADDARAQYYLRRGWQISGQGAIGEWQ